MNTSKIRRSSLLFATLTLFYCYGCTLIPLNEQFISTNRESSLARSKGSCNVELFTEKSANPELLNRSLSPDHISILSWNIYKGKSSGWQNDFEKYSKDKDIILLQEAPLHDEMRGLLKHGSLQWNFNSAFKYSGAEYGVMTASPVLPLESCGIRQDEPLIGLPKTIIISSFSIANHPQKLLVANIHGINITLGTGAYREQIEAMQRVIQKHHGPIILAGDFNNWTDERQAIIDQLVGELSLLVFPFENESRTTFFGDPVDHILYRGLKPFAHDVYSVTSSDHNPIAVAFRLATQALTNTTSQNMEIE